MKNEDKYPIGIFDSGIGGLLIAKEIKNQMPNENFIYFGDTANMPYGNKSKDFIINNSVKIVRFLYEKKCKAIIIACNTITSNALDIILNKFNNKILIFNVIDPIVRNKIFLSYKNIGIITTPSTAKSNFYIKKIKENYNHLKIIQISIPLLAYFIEYNFNLKKSINIISNYLFQLKSIELLILACTHYLYIKHEISNFYNGKVHLIDIQKIVVKEIKKKLKKKKLLSSTQWVNPSVFYYTSNYNFFFKKKVISLFGKSNFIEKYNY
ncbi:glutamate racemase [Blattabacterium cuenoti]|uniref:glutamate racemase n=1 Tax=Blattabacterium cuenoti TaxID=1653831 RepID=UPI00163C0D2B|nr:glutamate racemase [Blattabacterium cuenoti]